jgi:DNA repair ATPase RecN
MARRDKARKAEKRQQKRELRERDQTANVIQDTAARFTCSTEVASDFADQCASALEDLDCDLAFNRVAHEIWAARPGAGQQIAEALADFMSERERHAQALTALQQRFTALRDLGPQHEHIEPIAEYRELIRARLYPEHPPLPGPTPT